jgi:AcrR family transcriptional regulator
MLPLSSPTRTARPEAAPPRLRLPADLRIQQILDAALAVFSERGFMAARMDDIAHGAGLSKGGLYAHFNSKDEVLNALLMRSLTPPDLSELRRQRPDTVRHLAEWVVDGAYTQLASAQAVNTLRLLVAETERVPHLVALWYENVIKPHTQMLAEILQEFAREHGCSSSVLLREPWLAMAPVLHPLLMRLTMGLEADVPLAHYRDQHITLICELLTPRAAAAPSPQTPAPADQTAS